MDTLETEVKKWAQARHERELTIATLQDEVNKLLCKSVESTTESKRVELRVKRADAMVEIELQKAELQEVTRRYEIAVQADTEYKIQLAQDVYNKADYAAREKRQVLNAALEERLHFLNRGGRKGETPESINARRDIEVKIANAQAALTIANRETEETGRALKLAREQLTTT